MEKNPMVAVLYPILFERRRLKLPAIPIRRLGLSAPSVKIAGLSADDWDMDTPLNDLIFILQLARSRQAHRILEVGTYRAKSTYCLHLNCPSAEIISYDIQKIDSLYRSELEQLPNVNLRVGSFSHLGIELKKELPFDFIFIDADHRYDHVLADSLLAFDILTGQGVIVWHDYRRNAFFNPGLEVPEVMQELAKSRPIYTVPNTTCAIYFKPELKIRPEGASRLEEAGYH
jgi:predicted O-methyltransferase YrrM